MDDRRAPSIVPLCDLKIRPGATLDRLAHDARPVFLSRRGRTCAVLLSLEAYDSLLAGVSTKLETTETPPRTVRMNVRAGTEEDAACVLAAIRAGRGANPDELVKATGLSVSRVLIALTDLQLNGYVDPPGIPRRK